MIEDFLSKVLNVALGLIRPVPPCALWFRQALLQQGPIAVSRRGGGCAPRQQLEPCAGFNFHVDCPAGKD